MHVYVRFTKLVLNLRVTTYDLRQVTSPIMEVKRYYIVSYIFYIINPTAQKLIRVAQWVRSLDLTTRTSLSPIWSGFAPGFVNYKKGALDIAEILLKVALRHQQIKSKADYINNHILNVFKYIFNIQLIIKLQSDFLNE